MAVSSRAVQIDDKNPYSHYAVAVTNCFSGNFEPALRAVQRALALSPSFALGHCFHGVALLLSGHAKDAIEPFEHGLRLSPFDPQNFTFFCYKGIAHYFNDQFEQGLQAAQRVLELRPHWMPALKTVVLCARALGNEKLAGEALEEMKIAPDTRDNLVFVLEFNPTWAEHVKTVLSASVRLPQN